MKTKNGFTLLELLVVIGIIGILLSLVTVGFSGAQKQSRDARRRQDLAAIQNAMEQYYSENSFVYPDESNCETPTCVGIASYFTGGAVPRDPLATRNYVFTVDGAGSSYTVTATLEGLGTPVATVSALQ